ncbi:MAG: S53 family peptidase [Acidimicrobiales bacterium]
MRRAFFAALPAAAALAGALVLSGGVATPGRPTDGEHSQPYHELHASTATYLTEAQCLADGGIRLPCYDPAQIEDAYDEQPLFDEGVTGQGTTIAIVDSFGSPTIEHDLTVFDTTFGLPAPPSFRVIQPAGAVPPYLPHTTTMVGWAGETTLDVEWAHAIAPGAGILLVETPVSETEGTAGFPQIASAETYVIDHDLADVISQSFGANEHTFSSVQSFETLGTDYVEAQAQKITVLAATGDTGATAPITPTDDSYSATPAVTWPASDPLVTAVGGTQLTLDAAGQRTAPDRAWNDSYSARVNNFVFGTSTPHPDASGGGLSSVYASPSFQDGVADVVTGHRGIPDISMSAACSGLVDTYQSFGGPTPPGWYYVCGTSEATPLFAGIVALADQDAGHPLGLLNPALYAMGQAEEPGIVPVSQGDNTVSFEQDGGTHTVSGFDAAAGYNLVTGLGTVDAALFVPELVRAVAEVGSAATYALFTAGGGQSGS